VAAWVTDIFYSFHIVKNNKIPKKNSRTTKAREKISAYIELLEFKEFF